MENLSLNPPFPVPTKQLTVDIKGTKTDIVICGYEDHFFIIVTQIGSMGTIMQARKEEGMSVLPTFSVSVLFGKRDEPLLLASARQLIENISWKETKKTKHAPNKLIYENEADVGS